MDGTPSQGPMAVLLDEAWAKAAFGATGVIPLRAKERWRPSQIESSQGNEGGGMTEASSAFTWMRAKGTKNCKHEMLVDVYCKCIHIYTYVYIHIYIYICVCVCCVDRCIALAGRPPSDVRISRVSKETYLPTHANHRTAKGGALEKSASCRQAAHCSLGANA